MKITQFVLMCGLLRREALAFSPGCVTRIAKTQFSVGRSLIRPTRLHLAQNEKGSLDEPEVCWNPKLRRTMGIVSLAGFLETGYLTASKLVGAETMCGPSSTCSEILSGPYSYVPGTEIPLSLLGFVSYSAVAFLAFDPIFRKEYEDDSWNRVLLAATTTAMGAFSLFLMYLLFGVLDGNCPYCLASAAFSIVLAKLTWLGGVVPKGKIKEGVQFSAGGIVTVATVASLMLTNGDATSAAMTNFAGTPTTLIAKNSQQQLFSPPPIETESSKRAMALATDLESLDAKMYGAYWCSHCFDQKTRLGKEAFAKVQYLECAKDGVDSQSKACKARDVPGYPTWEIGGQLFPGEQALDELEEIVQKVKSSVVI